MSFLYYSVDTVMVSVQIFQGFCSICWLQCRFSCCCCSSLCFHCSSSSRIWYSWGESLSQWCGCLFNTSSKHSLCKGEKFVFPLPLRKHERNKMEMSQSIHDLFLNNRAGKWSIYWESQISCLSPKIGLNGETKWFILV